MSATVKSLLFVAFMGLTALVRAEDAPRKPDVRLIIDVSGSMKRNDPNNLRQPAVDLLVRLLPEGSKAGVWTFGRYVNMLVPHQPVDDAWRELAKSKAKDINSVGLFTNIGEALERAAHDVAYPKAGFDTSIILLTDGMVDVDKSPNKNKAEWRRIVDEVLPRLKDAGFTVHTVALSDKADKDLLQKLALSTDGIAAVASNAEDLLKIFLDAFDASAPAQKVPLVNNSFVVDSSVEEFTALIFRQVASEETELLGPDEKVIRQATASEDVNWHHTDQYDLITVKQPLEGEWQIKAAVAPDSRVTVVSDLRLRIKTLPNNTFRGAIETLSFVLLEEGKTVVNPEFLNLLTNTVRVGFGKDDTSMAQIWQYDFSQAPQPKNGIYTTTLPTFSTLGTYDIQVTVDGKTFKRETTHRLQVREPFSAELSETVDAQGKSQHLLTVRAHGDDVMLDKTQIAAAIVNPKRRKVVKPLVLSEFDNWQTLLTFDMPGAYSIAVQVTGEDAMGEAFEYQLTPLTWQNNPDTLFETQPEPEVLPDPVVELEPESELESEPEPESESEPTDEPAPEEASVSDNNESPPQGAQGLPKWVLYGLLVLGNLVLLGGGYWIFKKLMSDSSEDLEDEEEDEAFDQMADAQADEVDEFPAEEIEPALPMDDGGGEDEEPPMEDLDDGEQSFDEDESEELDEKDIEPPVLDESPMEESIELPEDTATAEDDIARAMAAMDGVEDEASVEASPELKDAAPQEDEDDFGVDDLEEELREQIDEMGGDSEDSTEEDFTREAAIQQGLDIPEDELDDAISSLIDELDGDRSRSDSDIDDFDDFGLDDKDK